ncbi:MAG: hypothetical protein WB816_15165 [Methylocystis sp.]
MSADSSMMNAAVDTSSGVAARGGMNGVAPSPAEDPLSAFLTDLDLKAFKREEEETIAERERTVESSTFAIEALERFQKVALYARSRILPEGWVLAARHVRRRVLELRLVTPHGYANVFLEAISREVGVNITWVKERALTTEDVALPERVTLDGLAPPFIDNVIKELAAEATAGAVKRNGQS